MMVKIALNIKFLTRFLVADTNRTMTTDGDGRSAWNPANDPTYRCRPCNCYCTADVRPANGPAQSRANRMKCPATKCPSDAAADRTRQNDVWAIRADRRRPYGWRRRAEKNRPVDGWCCSVDRRRQCRRWRHFAGNSPCRRHHSVPDAWKRLRSGRRDGRAMYWRWWATMWTRMMRRTRPDWPASRTTRTWAIASSWPFRRRLCWVGPWAGRQSTVLWDCRPVGHRRRWSHFCPQW